MEEAKQGTGMKAILGWGRRSKRSDRKKASSLYFKLLFCTLLLSKKLLRCTMYVERNINFCRNAAKRIHIFHRADADVGRAGWRKWRPFSRTMTSHLALLFLRPRDLSLCVVFGLFWPLMSRPDLSLVSFVSMRSSGTEVSLPTLLDEGKRKSKSAEYNTSDLFDDNP